MNVLVLNAGSSSLKFQVIATDLEQIKQYKDDRVLRGEIEGIGGEGIVKVRYRQQPGKTLTAAWFPGARRPRCATISPACRLEPSSSSKRRSAQTLAIPTMPIPQNVGWCG